MFDFIWLDIDSRLQTNDSTVLVTQLYHVMTRLEKIFGDSDSYHFIVIDPYVKSASVDVYCPSSEINILGVLWEYRNYVSRCLLTVRSFYSCSEVRVLVGKLTCSLLAYE